ncbi:MAG: amino acid ABC transporter permease [Dichotomicrobium sp.]
MSGRAGHFVREELAGARPAPPRRRGAARWAWDNLLGTPANAALTVLGLLIVWWLAEAVLQFALFDAVWTGASGADCRGFAGACWPFIAAKLDQFVYGRYPDTELWRVHAAGAGVALGLFAVLSPGTPRKLIVVPALFVILPVAIAGLLYGGVFGLPVVDTPRWGGLMLTLVIALSGIGGSLPLGVLLALGRRSDLPVIRWFCTAFIELWRGVPLVTVLFMASVLLPLFLPAGVTFDKLLRALIAVALFAAAYVAEVVRGGLQSIGEGQYEAARALGLGYSRMMGLVVLPQALKNVIPALVNVFIGLFKDTTLVLTIGLLDFLGMIQLGLSDASWSAPYVSHTAYLFAGVVFWAFCFSLSRYAASLERRLGAGADPRRF